MSANRTYAFIQVGDEPFDYWTDYQIGHDVLNATNSFAFHAPILSGKFHQRELTARGLYAGQYCDIFITAESTKKPVQVLKGRIQEVEITESRDGGAIVSVSGADHMHELVDADVRPSIALENVSFQDVIKRILVDQFGYSLSQIAIDNDANRALTTGNPAANVKLSTNAPKALEELKVHQAKPHPGETAYAYLKRHATRFGLLIWGTADGGVVIGRPNYEQRPLYSLKLLENAAGIANNVKHMTRRTSVKHRPVEVHVYGYTNGHDALRSTVHAVAVDDEMAAVFGGSDLSTGAQASRIITIHDQHAKTPEQAEQRAKYELSIRRQTADIIHATVFGHSAENGTAYAVDTTVDVQWDRGSVHDKRYVSARVFTRSRGGGTETQLEILPLNSIGLGDPEAMAPVVKPSNVVTLDKVIITPD